MMEPGGKLQLPDLIDLEQALLHTDHRRDPPGLERLLADDFSEIAGNGRASTRKQVLAWLLAKDPNARWRITDPAMHRLADDLYLHTYHAKQTAPEISQSKGTRYASLWWFNPALPGWQLRFHQATRVQ